jgi:hypothetical protein
LAHLRLRHLAGTHGGALGSTLGSSDDFVGALSLDALNVLLVLDFLLDVLVALEDLIVLDFAHLKSLVHLGFEFLLEGSHLVSLLGHEVGLAGKDLLVHFDHVLFALHLLELLGADLHLVSLLIVLLSGHLLLDLAQVEQLSGRFVQRGQFCLQLLSVLLKLLSVSLFEGEDLVLVIGLSLLELVVPMLVEVLVLLDVGLLALLSLLLVHKDEFLLSSVELLFLEFSNSVLGHLCLDVAALLLASGAMFLHCSTTYKILLRNSVASEHSD